MLALLALGPLLWRLTRPAAAEALTPPVPSHVARAAAIDVQVNFSGRADRVAVQHLGAEIWNKVNPSLDERFACQIPWPKEGVELRVLIGWPEGAPVAAMRLRVTSPDGTEHDRTVWGSGAVEDVVVFK